jgi:hypothetical protein
MGLLYLYTVTAAVGHYYRQKESAFRLSSLRGHRRQKQEHSKAYKRRVLLLCDTLYMNVTAYGRNLVHMF